MTATFCMLQDLASAYHVSKNRPDQKTWLHAYLAHSLPFGAPIDTLNSNFDTLLKKQFSHKENLFRKRPSWKWFTTPGKQKITITIRDGIASAQYDRKDILDHWIASGCIVCNVSEKWKD